MTGGFFAGKNHNVTDDFPARSYKPWGSQCSKPSGDFQCHGRKSPRFPCMRRGNLNMFQLNNRGNMGVSWVIVVPPVIIHFERWDFPWRKPTSYGGTRKFEETPIYESIEIMGFKMLQAILAYWKRLPCERKSMHFLVTPGKAGESISIHLGFSIFLG